MLQEFARLHLHLNNIVDPAGSGSESGGGENEGEEDVGGGIGGGEGELGGYGGRELGGDGEDTGGDTASGVSGVPTKEPCTIRIRALYYPQKRPAHAFAALSIGAAARSRPQ